MLLHQSRSSQIHFLDDDASVTCGSCAFHVSGAGELTRMGSCGEGYTALSLSSRKIQKFSAEVFREGIPALTYLSLGINKISSLPSGVFDDLKSLTYLSLEQNNLTHVPERLLGDLGNLQVVVLDLNQISSLPERVFQGLWHLQAVLLQHNQLATLPEDIFQDLRDLKQVWLAGNKISFLPARTFHALSNLEWLDPGENHLSSVSAEILRGLSQLTFLSLFLSLICSVNLMDNPIDCKHASWSSNVILDAVRVGSSS